MQNSPTFRSFAYNICQTKPQSMACTFLDSWNQLRYLRWCYWPAKICRQKERAQSHSMPKLFVVRCCPPNKFFHSLPASRSPGAILQLLGLGCMSCTSSSWLCLCRGICGVGWRWTATKPTGNFSKDYLWETPGKIAKWPMYLNTYTPIPTAGQINWLHMRCMLKIWIIAYGDSGVNMQDPKRMARHYGRISKGPSLCATQWLNLNAVAILYCSMSVVLPCKC